MRFRRPASSCDDDVRVRARASSSIRHPSHQSIIIIRVSRLSRVRIRPYPLCHFKSYTPWKSSTKTKKRYENHNRRERSRRSTTMMTMLPSKMRSLVESSFFCFRHHLLSMISSIDDFTDGCARVIGGFQGVNYSIRFKLTARLDVDIPGNSGEIGRQVRPRLDCYYYTD